MSSPRIGVLALQGDVREHARALEACDAQAVPLRRPSELAQVDGVVLPGGESTTIGKLLVAFDLLEPLRSAVAAGLPAYGSCAGMILLARDVIDGIPEQPLVGGLDVVVRRNAFGRQVDSFEGQIRVAGIGDEPLHAVFIRAPWVERVDDGVEVLARLGREVRSLADGSAPGAEAERVVAVRQGSVLATAFHPELTGDLRVHGMFVDMVRAVG